MHLIAVLILGVSFVSFADEFGSNTDDFGASPIVIHEETHSSKDRALDYLDGDMLTTEFIFTNSAPMVIRAPNVEPTEPTINHTPKIVVDTLISTIPESEKGISEAPAILTQHEDELKNMNPTSKSAFHELSTSLPSKDSIVRRMTPKNSVQHFSNDNVSVRDIKLKNITENVTSPTESQMYNTEPTLSTTDNFLLERSSENSQLYSVTGSSKITSNFYEMHYLEILKNETEENLDLFLSKRQDKSASIDNQQGSNFLPGSVTPPYSPLNTDSEFPVLSTYPHNPSSYTTVTASVYEISSVSDSTLKAEVGIEPPPTTFVSQQTPYKNWSEPLEVHIEAPPTTFVSQQTPYKNWSEPSDADLIVIEDRAVIIKENEEYTVGFSKNCSNNSSVYRLLHLLNTSPNSKKTNFTCKDLNDVKISVKSKELFDKFTELVKEEIKNMVFIKFHRNATLTFDSFSSYDGIFIPNQIVMALGTLMLFVLMMITCAVLYKMKCCQRKDAASLDLHHIPHLDLKTDYNLTPIPRPSVSFTDSSRDFLHAYAQDNSNRSRQDSTLNKRNYSSANVKTYEDIEKEIGSKQEMQTFTMSSGRKSEFRASENQACASPYSWDRLQEKKYPRKYGMDNPGYKKW